ncbi:hypothetical protein D9M68_277320 [compost metagenome]
MVAFGTVPMKPRFASAKSLVSPKGSVFSRFACSACVAGSASLAACAWPVPASSMAIIALTASAVGL